MLNTIMNHSEPQQPDHQATLSSLSSLNNTKIFKPVINLESDDITAVKEDNNHSMPSIIPSDKTRRGLGSTSLTPIDLTRSNSQSVWMSNTNTMSNSITTSNPNSSSSSPLVPKLVSSSNMSNISDRKRRYQDPSTDPMMHKRQKLENGSAATPTNMYSNMNANPLSTLQQQLLAGKHQNIYNNQSTQRKQIDITLVQLVNYLKSQFAKLQQQNQNKYTNVRETLQASQTPQQPNVQHIIPAQPPQNQQGLMDMMNNNNNNNTKTALLQSLLNLKLKQQQQQQQKNLLLNAALIHQHQQQRNEEKANNTANLLKLMVNLQNVQKMNNVSAMNNMMLHKNNATPPNYASFGAASKSLTNSTSPRKNIEPLNEPISLLSDDEDNEQQLNYIHTNHKNKKGKEKKGKKRKKHNKKHKHHQMMTNSDNTDIEVLDENRKRGRSPSATSTLSDTLSTNNTNNNHSTEGNESDESYKAYNINTLKTKPRQRRKRMCNIDKEFDEEERLIKYKEDMMHLNEPISGNAYIVAYAESLHLDDMKLKKDEVFPILRQMPRSALIKYCDYYKLRHSKRSKDNRLLQIVTKHFILHNREKNAYKSVEDLEQDLFWHSVCHNKE